MANYRSLQRGVNLLLVTTSLLLGACAPTPTKPPAEQSQPADSSPAAQWQRHQTRLDALLDWSMTGRVAIKADGEGYHATLDWQQQNDDIELRVSGPFAQGSVRLTGNSEHLLLTDGRDTRLEATSADELIRQATGLKVPVDGLRYWLRGLPVPPAAGEQTLDGQGRLQRLEQGGWIIDYRAYVDVDGLALPRKLFLQRPDLSVRLVVDRWRL